MKHLLKLSLLVILFTSPLIARPVAREKRSSRLSKNSASVTKPFLKEEEHFTALQTAVEHKEWKIALQHVAIIEGNFQQSPLYKPARYFAACARFNGGFLVEANRDLSAYLDASLPDHFQEALSYKFEIAQKFGRGESGHYPRMKKIFTERSFPERAIQIYDDILLYSPTSELAAYALFHKGQLQLSELDYDESIESFKTLIHDFVGHELLPQAYFGISQNYFARYDGERSKEPEMLELAFVNLNEFEKKYPSHELLEKSRELYAGMRASYAWELYDVGRYFEKRKKKKAAALYYRDICERFADTPAAETCQQHHAQVLSLVPSSSSQ